MADTNNDEADGKDEILCPCDLGRTYQSWQRNAIRDDWLKTKFHDELPVGVRCVCVYEYAGLVLEPHSRPREQPHLAGGLSPPVPRLHTFTLAEQQLQPFA